MDFGGLPPEINSARMYAGPGSSSMQAAASAWDSLAAELRTTATSYGTVVSELADDTWQGPSSAAMEDAATPYVAWLNAAAAEAEQTATQARAAANAYQTAFASVVPPEVVTLNRAQLASLMATNTFGQNTPAIATNEAQYGEMWAQDATAMYSYAGTSATASKVTTFTPPPSTTNASGAASQSAATAQAVGTSSGAGVQSTLSQLTSSIPSSLQGLSSPAASSTTSTSLSTLLTNLLNSLTSTSSTTATSGLPGLGTTASGAVADAENYVGLFALFMGLDAMGPLISGPISNMVNSAMLPAAAAAAPAIGAAGGVAAAMGGAVGGFAGAAGGLGGLSGLGAAASVGALSVPPSWAMAATPALVGAMPLASALPGLADSSGLPFGLPVIPGGLGRAAGVAAAAGVGGAVASRYAPRLKVLTRSPGAGYSETPMAPAGAYGVPAGLPPAPGYTPHIVYLPNNGNGNNGNGHNGYNGNGHNGNGKH
jgi:PPE-repeat protein